MQPIIRLFNIIISLNGLTVMADIQLLINTLK